MQCSLHFELGFDQATPLSVPLSSYLDVAQEEFAATLHGKQFHLQINITRAHE
jgi:hypothetical protein